MNLGEFYEDVEALAADFAEEGRIEDGRRIMDALRGGSTSGEVLASLYVVLREVPDSGDEDGRIDALLDFIRHAHGPPPWRT